MIKHILVPMGASKISGNSLKAAVDLANQLKAHLRLLYIENIEKIKSIVIAHKAVGSVSLDTPEYWRGQDGIREIREEIEKEKAVIQGIYQEVAGDIMGSHELVCREGNVADEILQEIRMTDLVVMGKSLKKDETDCTFLHPVIFEVVQKSSRPILTVCEKGRIGDSVIMAYDGSRSSVNSLKVLGDLIPCLNPAVSIVTVKKNQAEADPLLGEAASYLERYGITAEKIWKSGNVNDMIVAAAEEKNASLIVIGGYGDNRLKESLLGSTTEKLLRTVKIPVLLSNG